MRTIAKPWTVRLSAKHALVLLSVLATAACKDPFIQIIDTPGIAVAERYSVEAIVYPGPDTSTVFITRTSTETNPVDPRFQEALSVTVRINGGEPIAFTPCSTELVNDLGRVPVVYFAHAFGSDELPTGAELRLAIELADGTLLMSVAEVPRPATAFEPRINLSAELYAFATGNVRINDAPGPDAYLLRGRIRPYGPKLDDNFRPIPGEIDSAEANLEFVTESGFSRRDYGSRFVVADRQFDGVGTNPALQVSFPVFADSNRVEYRLSTINREGFDYLDAAQRAAAQADNILVEPAILPSNIVGGTGGFVVSSRPLVRVERLVVR